MYNVLNTNVAKFKSYLLLLSKQEIKTLII